MSAKIAVIYVPGLGDGLLRVQGLFVAAWRVYGVHPIMYQIAWSKGDSFQPKLDGLIERIDLLVSEGYDVALIGASAGGSAVINAYVERSDKIVAVVGICGVMNGDLKIGPIYADANPAFVESVALLSTRKQEISDEGYAKISSYVAFADGIVSSRESMVGHNRLRRMPIVNHFLGVTLGLTLWSYFIIRTIKLTAKNR